MDLKERMKKINRYFFLLAAFALFLMMMLTVVDVILRELGLAIVGTYELVGFAAVIVVGFCIPYTTSLQGHIIVTFFTTKMGGSAQKVFFVFTRLIGICLFCLVGYNLFLLGRTLFTSGEVSMTLRMPFYPIAFCIGACCFLQVFTQIIDIVAALRRKS